ncbi:EamA family transporter, partial [Streptomyces sp. MBT61]|nr:EamA family transporter [Streptomyces sp. MBT61]
MRAQDSATPSSAIAVADPAATPHPTSAATSPAVPPAGPPATSPAGRSGTVLAGLGVVAFSLTFPATAWGLESFGPWSLVALRSVLAALVAGGVLLAARDQGGEHAAQ